jgi:hypothetical protein
VEKKLFATCAYLWLGCGQQEDGKPDPGLTGMRLLVEQM